MNHHDADTLHLIVRERQEERRREADAERLAHLLRIRAQQPRQPRFTISDSLKPSGLSAAAVSPPRWAPTSRDSDAGRSPTTRTGVRG